MATPQWILVQRRLEPTKKTNETQFEKNAKRRQREAVKSALKKGVIRILNQDLISQCESSFHNLQEKEQLKRISLPSLYIQSIDELVILCCPQLSIINLPYNYISDITPLQSCINLIKLDLSGNQIRVLPDTNFWSGFVHLKILYLNGNLIGSKGCILKLAGCPQLQVLTLHDTPVSLLSKYRHIAVNCILSLKALDYHIISDEEIIENLHLSGKFRALARSFHKPLYLPINMNDNVEVEMKQIHNLLLVIDRIQAHYCPVIIIQRWTRGWLTRIQLSRNANLQISALVTRKKNVNDSDQIKDNQSKLTPNKTSISPSSVDLILRSKTPDVDKIIHNAKNILKKDVIKKKKGNKSFIPKLPRVTSLPSYGSDELIVQGKHQSIEEINKQNEMKMMICNGGQDLRSAKKEISRLVHEEKHAVPEIDYEKIKPELTKDMHSFIRAHATMSLSMLKLLENSYRSNRKAKELAMKANTVAQIKQDREIRKEKILQHQQMIKETVLNWKATEDNRLEKKMKEIEQKDEEEHVKQVIKCEDAAEETKKKKDKQIFSVKFRQEHITLERKLAQNRKKAIQKTESEMIQQHVNDIKEVDKERQEIVKSFMQLRQSKIRREIEQSKDEFSARMIQIASEQLREARQRVTQEKVRKLTATVPCVSDPIETHKHNLSEVLSSIPTTQHQIPNSLLLKRTESRSSRASGGMELGRSWQRGHRALQQSRTPHFPEILHASDTTPLMYNMYMPLPHFQKALTPFNSCGTSPIILEPPHNDNYLYEMYQQHPYVVQDEFDSLSL